MNYGRIFTLQFSLCITPNSTNINTTLIHFWDYTWDEWMNTYFLHLVITTDCPLSTAIADSKQGMEQSAPNPFANEHRFPLNELMTLQVS